jgi:hypothetical protein
MEDIRIMLKAENSPKTVLEKIWGFNTDNQCKIILFMWCWWSARNKTNSGERKKSAHEVINDFYFHFQVWRDTTHMREALTSNSKPK